MNRTKQLYLLLCLLVISFTTVFGFAQTNRSENFELSASWPTQEFRTSTPEEQGMDSGQLAKAFDFIQENEINIHSLLVVRNGYLILEAYFYPNRRGIMHDLASVTKSITSAIIGIAIDKGYIENVKLPMLDFFPDRLISNLDERKKRITLEDMLTMRTGFCRSFQHGEEQLAQMRQTNDWVQFMLDQPLVSDPGTEFAYCTGASHLLSAIITQATGVNELEFARQNLFQPIGIQDVIWPTDPQGNNTGGWDFFMHSRDMAKFGYLFLQEGKWEDKQIISQKWVQQSTRQHVRFDGGEGYAYRWWLPGGNPGIYEGRGRGGQRISVWPQKNLVAVFTGSGFEPGDIGAFLIQSMLSTKPLPENPEGYRHLREKIESAAKVPVPKLVPALPPIAHEISGKQFIFEPNAFGLNSFYLIFKNKTEALLRLSESDGDTENPIGLDDIYRISNQSRFGLPEAMKGSWTTDHDFDIIDNEVANNHLYRLTFTFWHDRAKVRIVENTGLVNITIEATLEK